MPIMKISSLFPLSGILIKWAYISFSDLIGENTYIVKDFTLTHPHTSSQLIARDTSNYAIKF